MTVRARGFTLIEIMVVVVILAILGTLVAPQILGRIDEARVTKAKNDLRLYESALDLYRMDNFHYPTTDQGLEALVTKPADPNLKNREGKTAVDMAPHIRGRQDWDWKKMDTFLLLKKGGG